MLESAFIDEGRLPGPPVARRPRLSHRRPARTHWSLTREAFERLLRWLSPDRDEAGRRYEQARVRLIGFFTRGGCNRPAELFDRTIDRACSKIELDGHECSGDALAFCFAVGRFVLREYWREVKVHPIEEDISRPESEDPEIRERELEWLETSLAGLSQRDRNLITAYYQGVGRERIQRRRDLASAAGGINALRIQVFRIRAKLRRSLFERAALYQGQGEIYLGTR